MSLITLVLPPGVRGAELFGHPEQFDLFPAELARLERAVSKRKREYAAARRCARAVLAELGHPPGPILNGERGMPLWPDGVVGSMTHCAGYAAAALAPNALRRGLGIDAEPHLPLPDGVLELVSVPQEREWLAARLAADPATHWDRLLFSAKESLYKCWFPLTRRWLGFHEARIDLGPGAGEFVATVPEAAADRRSFPGRWATADGVLVTSVWC